LSCVATALLHSSCVIQLNNSQLLAPYIYVTVFTAMSKLSEDPLPALPCYGLVGALAEEAAAAQADAAAEALTGADWGAGRVVVGAA